MIELDALLDGPRGRRLCWQLLGAAGGADELAALAAAHGPAAFLSELARSVTAAMYWQEPDDEDLRLAEPGARDALIPVAETIAATPAVQWWSSPMDAGAQCEVGFDDDDTESLDPDEHGRAALVAWRRETLDLERRAAGFPEDPRANYSSHWWSTPAGAGVCTARALPRCGPVGLRLVEDGLGWTSARCWSVAPRGDAKVLEVGSAQDWAELVARYPLAVPRSRRYDWFRATGRDLRWAIPDYLAVAADYDAIHVTVAGYLSTAGRALPAGDFHTVLAGWDPDETLWLTDRPVRISDAVRWRATGEPDPFAWATATRP